MKEKEKHPNPSSKKKSKKQKHEHSQPTKPSGPDISFKPSSEVKGLKFGAQKLITQSFTVRRSRPAELSLLLNLTPPPPTTTNSPPFPSTVAYLPTNFTILAHQAWHTLTLGLGTRKSKVVIFVFSSPAARAAAADRAWPPEIPLGEVNRRLVRGLPGWELARFKFRKGCLTFYVFAVRPAGEAAFHCADDLRSILHSVVALRDFLDHTAMLALPSQRSIVHSPSFRNHNTTSNPVAAH